MIDGRRRGEASTPSTEHERPTSGRGIGAVFVRLRISADLVTACGVLIAAATGIAIGYGHLWIGAGLLTVGGLADTLDGVVAKAAGTSSPRGAYLDSVADRVSDAFIFTGVSGYLIVGPNPREALIPIGILAIGNMISYQRAKAESLGFSAKGGLMERAERLIALGAALVFNVVLVPLLLVLLALTTATALGRFVRVWRQASPVVAAGGSPDAVPLVGESRWHTWREQNRVQRSRSRARARARTGPEPIATRLRRVLSTTGTTTPSRQRGARRARTSSALLRRFDSSR